MKRTLSVMVAATLVIAGVIATLQLSDASNAQDKEARPGDVKEYFPDVQTKLVSYKDGDAECEGFMAWDANMDGKRSVVLVVHDWMGRGKFDEQRSRELAAMGYLAFSVDVYGKNVRPKNRDEAAKAAGSWRGADRGPFRTRLKAGMTAALASDQADAESVAAIGYCFGGTAVMELARSGANLRGVVPFHGGYGSEPGGDAANIKAKVLVLHGADDNFDGVVVLNNELKEAGVDYEIDLYGHAVHAFTNPDAGDNPTAGVAYDAQADERSWIRMKDFLWEVLD
ncbi:MAG: dienelactone hydrolase family protein [Planctomycetes bacterium]|nr:dienelactone hydrolase family protein [Planctomycetota bacterium]